MSLAREHIQLFFCVVASSRGGSRKAFLGIAPVSHPGVRYTRERQVYMIIRVQRGKSRKEVTQSVACMFIIHYDLFGMVVHFVC